MVVLVDIDGTVADCNDRAARYLRCDKPDWDAFYEHCADDKPIFNIIHIVRTLGRIYPVVFVTGRRESCRAATERWIRKFFGVEWVPSHYHMHMRADGDKRHDTEVKPELVQLAGLTPKDVIGVLEDRNSMVKKWRELGFTCLQVAEGDF